MWFSIIATMGILGLGQASTIPTRRQLNDIFANEGEPCTVGRQKGECDRFGRCFQFIPPNENSILNQGRPVAECTRTPAGQEDVDSGFGDFASGRGSALFGNVGTTCVVGRKEGECDRFGRCTQFIPPNEISVLNQGRIVDVCTAGGQVGTLRV